MKVREGITTLLRWALMLVGLAILVSVVEVAFAPIRTIPNLYRIGRLPARLQNARNLWRSTRMDSYSYDVVAELPFCWFEATLEVEGGRLAQVNEHEVVDFLCPQPLAYSDLLVPAMHSRVANELIEIDPLQISLTVEFDAELGFVSLYRQQCAYRTGMPDCTYEYRFYNFRTSEGIEEE